MFHDVYLSYISIFQGICHRLSYSAWVTCLYTTWKNICLKMCGFFIGFWPSPHLSWNQRSRGSALETEGWPDTHIYSFWEAWDRSWPLLSTVKAGQGYLPRYQKPKKRWWKITKEWKLYTRRGRVVGRCLWTYLVDFAHSCNCLST